MLSQEQAQQVQLVLSMGGWHGVMKPAIVNRGKLATKALVLTPAERSAVFKGTDFDTDDNVLRAVIRDCEWMAVVWDNEVSIAQHNQQRDELDAANPPANP